MEPSTLTVDDLPCRVIAVDIGHSDQIPIAAEGYRSVRVLVRSADEPIGYTDFPAHASALATRSSLVDRLPPDVQARLRRQSSAVDAAPTTSSLRNVDISDVSVVICTRERPKMLQRALMSLLQAAPGAQLVVVDNGPITGRTRDVVTSLRSADVDYVVEPVPGLSRARNRGVDASSGRYVAFTDDDVVVDELWLRALRRGFTRDRHIGCVTGLVPAVELRTASQLFFETKLRWGRALVPRIYTGQPPHDANALYPFSAGIFGAGANFAVSRELVDVIGGFDVALGAGAPARGGEDLDYFTRTILADFAIAYEPAAIVWHYHRDTEPELLAQMRGYGSGLAAHAWKHLTRGPKRGLLLRAMLRESSRIGREVVGRQDVAAVATRGSRRAEILGILEGPWLYERGRRRARYSSR